MERNKIQEYLEGVETARAYKGYSYSIGDALTLVILGSMRGLRNVSQIHQWAENDRIREFLKKHLEDGREMTLSFDGKTICSTGAMERYENLVHIVSAHIAELGITLGQQTLSGKSNEIPALRELLDILALEGCMVVADAPHCQKETAKAVVAKQADYLLSVKDNQPTPKGAC